TYTGPWTSVEDTSIRPTPDSPPMPPAASTQIGYGSTSSSGPSRDAQTSNSAHSHQPVQRSHLAAALKRGVKFIYPSPSSSSAKENNDSLTKYSISSGSSNSLSEFMIPLIIPPTYNSFTDTSKSSSKVSRAGSLEPVIRWQQILTAAALIPRKRTVLESPGAAEDFVVAALRLPPLPGTTKSPPACYSPAAHSPSKGCARRWTSESRWPPERRTVIRVTGLPASQPDD
ncbi:hypothetical protein V500_01550, partial [Pseudogymnoascus sp. VKM F-4518 (FW-2643)]